MKFGGLKVGDKVAVSLHRGHAEWTVEKVGRKYFTAGRCEFRLEDGTSTSGYSSPRASTLEDHARAMRVAEADKALRAMHVEISYRAGSRGELVLAVYEALKPMIAAEALRSESVEP